MTEAWSACSCACFSLCRVQDLSLQGDHISITEASLTCGGTLREGMFSNSFEWFKTDFSVYCFIAGRIHL